MCSRIGFFMIITSSVLPTIIAEGFDFHKYPACPTKSRLRHLRNIFLSFHQSILKVTYPLSNNTEVEKGKTVSGSVTWLVEGKLLLFNSWGKVNVNELKEMDHRIGAMLESSTAPLVHGIHDHSRAEHIPSAKDLMKVKSGNHPRVGWLIIVGLDNKLMKFFVSATGQVFGLRLRFMNSVAEALDFLQDVDSTLPDLQSIDLTAAETRIRETGVTLAEIPEPT